MSDRLFDALIWPFLIVAVAGVIAGIASVVLVSPAFVAPVLVCAYGAGLAAAYIYGSDGR